MSVAARRVIMNDKMGKVVTPEEEIFNNFKIDVPEYFNFASDVVDRWAQKDRNKLAMIWVNQNGEEKRFTFNDLSKLSNQAANLLLKHGIRKGDYVFLMLPRVPEWWIFSLALVRLGAIQCPSPTLLTPPDLKHRIKCGRFKAVITDMDNAPKFDEVYNDCPTLSTRIITDGSRPNWISYPEAVSSPTPLSRHEVKTPFAITTRSDDPLLCMFTSGTSKYPKMVLHKVSYALGHRITAELWHGLSSNDLHFAVSDTGWGKNLWGNYFGQWIVGACVFIYDVIGKFHADELLPLLDKYGISSFCAPPTVYRMLILNDLTKFDLSQLRRCCSAGEPLNSETIRIWREATRITINDAYGQTETVCMIGTFINVKPRLGSMGKAAPYWKVRLLDDDFNDVPVGESGRIAVELDPMPPIGLFLRYINNDEENQKAFQRGFYFTGDKARIDSDGYYWFVGRNDDIIKSSGYRIGPLEVEEAIIKHPSVHEVAVVGAPDPLRGMLVRAYIVLHAGYTPTESLVGEIQKFVKHETAPYKYPREIEFVKSLPKTFSGKIKRDLLRHHAETGEYWE